MAKKAATKKKTTKKKTSKKKASSRAAMPSAAGKQLVIVESPAKARTINKYLGSEYVVVASVGHVRDLPPRAPKGVKQPVPGVDLENNFEPTYEVLANKKKTVSDLKKAAKGADGIWFATDMDREGEAIAWHLAELLGVPAKDAKRVIFNAITKAEILKAFDHPRPIDEYKVNAQQARRILDRIVGYQASPLLWKMVAGGLSAGRVQSVAVRLVVEREAEIQKFVPNESWDVPVRLALKPADAAALSDAWPTFMATLDDRKKPPSIKRQNAWLAEHTALATQLVELNGKKFALGCTAEAIEDLSASVESIAKDVGFASAKVTTTEDETGKGPARFRRVVSGTLDPATRYCVDSIETKQTTSRPQAPFITSSLQMTASSYLGFPTDRTMRVAQQLYEGVEVPGEGRVGLITYMRTDSTHLSREAVADARGFIDRTYGEGYLPTSPNAYTSKNADAQEAHEAIRPTLVGRTPEMLRGSLDEAQWKLYDLIWRRFTACQMTNAQWDSTAFRFKRSDQDTGAILRATGRVLVFDGFMKASGIPTATDEQTLPKLDEGHTTAPFSIEPLQKFSSPPPRYNEGSLVKKLEEEGIGRPSTYASIIKVIQARNYVEQLERRFHATDLGEVVTEKLIEGFPRLMDVGYTRDMEAKLDKVEDEHIDWRQMLAEFYERFSTSLARAYEEMTHAKAEMDPAPYACPECGARTAYRFGRNGRFLTCGKYPDCDYAAPIDREGRPLLPEQADIKCPEDGSQMIMRTGRFGKFIASPNYPDIKFVLNLDKKDGIKLPAPPPLETELTCPRCEERPMYLREGGRGPWLGCSGFPKCRGRESFAKLEDSEKAALTKALEDHVKAHPIAAVTRMDDTPIEAGTPIADLLIPGSVQELGRHADA